MGCEILSSSGKSDNVFLASLIDGFTLQSGKDDSSFSIAANESLVLLTSSYFNELSCSKTGSAESWIGRFSSVSCLSWFKLPKKEISKLFCESVREPQIKRISREFAFISNGD